MGTRVINIRGFTFAVEAASGSQLRFIENMMEKRTDIELCQYQKEYEFDGKHGTVRSVDSTEETPDTDTATDDEC